MVAQLLQAELSDILSVEVSLEFCAVLGVVTTCEDIGRVFLNFERRYEFAVDLSDLYNPLEHVVQLLQLSFVLLALRTLSL
jgi:hypothetical protein